MSNLKNMQKFPLKNNMFSFDEIYSHLKSLLTYAYVPYSKFAVSCLISADGILYAGVNVENASFGVTLCAERNALGSFVTNTGISKVDAVYLLSQSEEFCPPCGICRQMLVELCDQDTLIYMFNIHGVYIVATLSELLPHSFSQ